MPAEYDHMEISTEEKKSCEDENFAWHEYLESTGSNEVPQTAFLHVEQSLQSGLHEGMVLEVPNKHDNSTYWLASIVMACGPLLCLRYLGFEDERSQDFWCDLNKVRVYPIGWCNEHNIRLEPPKELRTRVVDCQTFVTKALESAESVPSQLLTGDGFTPVDRIRQGMKVEVQDKMDPHQLWVATIIENVGGRLLLRYDTPDSSSPDFWLFYSSPRLFPMGWAAEKGPPWTLKWPSDLKTHHGFEEWEAVLEMAKEDARRVPLPPDLFENDYYKIPVHNFTVGMKLEAIHPQNMVEICPATVIKIFRPCHFLVQIDSYDTVESKDDKWIWLCTAKHPYIFPAGWAQQRELRLTHPRGWTTSKEEFDWAEYLEATKSVTAPASCFSRWDSASEFGFAPEMKLEAVNPENQHQLSAASVVKIIDHLIWIHLESNDSFHPNHIVSMDSHEIFPVGWCESNSYPLKPPLSFQMPVKQEEKKILRKKKERDIAVNTAQQLQQQQQRSFWCPKIYFNHKCFSGPFLSKGKLAQLPKAVGPGPVTLVMREVLSMLISVAYKSSRVLKELQSDGKPKSGMHLEVLKAKYKSNTYRASVAIVTSAEEVPQFCKEVCSKLQVCPYMFGPVSIGENRCPENCNKLSKTKFTQYWLTGKRKLGRPKGEVSNLVPRPKKKRGRKKLSATSKMEESDSFKKLENVSADVEDAQSCQSPEDPISHGGNESEGSEDIVEISSSSENSPEATIVKRKYCKKQFPRSEIKTRGAKLPNFALQMRAGHWTRKQNKEAEHYSSSTNTRNSVQQSVTTRSLQLDENSDDVTMMETKETEKVSTGDAVRSKEMFVFEKPVELDSNPLHWSLDDVFDYLIKTNDCADVAQKCKDELIDGQAFMMLNYPTMRENLYLGLKQAIRLCRHVERVKLAFYLQYISNSEP